MSVVPKPGTVGERAVACSAAIKPCPVGSDRFKALPLIRHTLEIPGDFLNAGSYYVNMLIVKDASTGILFQNNVVVFEVVEGEVVGNWYGRNPGTVRPKLKWKSEVIDAGDLTASMARGQNF